MNFLTNYGAAVRCACVLSPAALTLIATLGLAGVLSEAQAATQSECVEAFDDSEASLSCELESASASGNNCSFEAVCEIAVVTFGDPSDDLSYTNIQVTLDDADDLVNCNGDLATSCEKPG